MRSAILIENEFKYLIDVGPDIREQLLTYKIKAIDLVLVTHAHYDHIGGIDDLRPLCYVAKAPLDLMLSKKSLASLKQSRPYMFQEKPKVSFVPTFNCFVFDDMAGSLTIKDRTIRYITYSHSDMAVNGFIIDNMAYITDIKEYDEAIFKHLNVDNIIITATKLYPTKLHIGLFEAIEFGKKAGAKKIWITHLSHEIDHEKVEKSLPENVFLAYDGLKITL